MIREHYEITCDLCADTQPSASSKPDPKKYLVFTIENPYHDRSFSEKHFCSRCVTIILNAVEKQQKK